MKNCREYPNFLYIGAAKAGSSWIYEMLRTHPEVFIPIAKDIQFFDKHYERGIEWYCSFFQPGVGKKAIGELSHNYFLSEEIAARIQQHLPHARLLCCLREPVDRIVSGYFFCRTIRINKNVPFANFAFEDNVLRGGDYYYNLLPFYQRFPRKNILVLFFDNLKKNPQQFVKRIYEFLEVDVSFESTMIFRKVLPASAPRLYWLAHQAYKTALMLRKLGLPNVVGSVKRNQLFRRLLYKRIHENPEIPNDIRQHLKAYYKERYQRLPELIGQSLPVGWFTE